MRYRRILGGAAVATALVAAQSSIAASPFATLMDRVCHMANAKVAAIGVSQSLYELTANEPRLLAADRSKLAALLKLGKAPSGVAAPFATYLALQRQIDGLDSQMVSAAKHARLTTVEQAQAEVVLLQKKQNGAARKIGAAACFSIPT